MPPRKASPRSGRGFRRWPEPGARNRSDGPDALLPTSPMNEKAAPHHDAQSHLLSCTMQGLHQRRTVVGHCDTGCKPAPRYPATDSITGKMRPQIVWQASLFPEWSGALKNKKFIRMSLACHTGSAQLRHRPQP
jgi:hypothetical protein